MILLLIFAIYLYSNKISYIRLYHRHDLRRISSALVMWNMLWRHDMETLSALPTHCEEIHQSSVDSPHKESVMRGFGVIRCYIMFVKSHHSFPQHMMIWKRFPHYWTFVHGIRWSPVDSPHEGPFSHAELSCVGLDKRLQKQSSRR